MTLVVYYKYSVMYTKLQKAYTRKYCMIEIEKRLGKGGDC